MSSEVQAGIESRAWLIITLAPSGGNTGSLTSLKVNGTIGRIDPDERNEAVHVL
jgi:hypothetical protein